MQVYAASDIGLIRKRNEDSLFIDRQAGVFAVCDGMGGHKGGDVASKMAVAALADTVQQADRPEDFLTAAVVAANTNIYTKSLIEPALQGMGTTMTSVHIERQHLSVRHVGDSALFLLRDRQISKLTTDHTLAAAIYNNNTSGTLNADHPYTHVLTRAVGIRPDIEIESLTYHLQERDILIICSDGLTDHVEPGEFIAVYNKLEHLRQYPQQLINLALQRGGLDNITVIVIEID